MQGKTEVPPRQRNGAAGPLCRLAPANRISASKNAVDQACNRLVQICHAIVTRVVGMGCRSIAQDADDLLFRKDVPVIQRKKKRLANCQSRSSGHIRDVFHSRILSLRANDADARCLRIPFTEEYRRPVVRMTDLDQRDRLHADLEVLKGRVSPSRHKHHERIGFDDTPAQSLCAKTGGLCRSFPRRTAVA